MTNTTYFYQVNRDYWSASTSTSPSDTPRPSSAEDEGDIATVEASSWSSTVIDYDLSAKLCGKLKSSNLKKFSFRELKIATSNFLPENNLGEDCFGPVFKGWIDQNRLTGSKPRNQGFRPVFKGWIDQNRPTGSKPGKAIPVAVKMLSQGSCQGPQQWLAEVNYLGKLYHPNLVKLFGYCIDKEKHLLVFEFMPLTSLNNHLFGDSCQLSWSHRMKIALGAAKGIAFLHKDEINVIHRDIMCSTILLDSDYNAKLSDFGLAIDGPAEDMSHVCTTVAGTFGYIDPEYCLTGNLTAKSDVYSFGVVLLEILSGRKTMDICESSGEPNCAEWAKLNLNDEKILWVLDPNLEFQCLLGCAQKACNLALLCIAGEAKLRPTMDEVVRELEGLQDYKEKGEDSNLSQWANFLR